MKPLTTNERAYVANRSLVFITRTYPGPKLDFDVTISINIPRRGRYDRRYDYLWDLIEQICELSGVKTK